MTRKPITSVEEADRLLESLSWMRGAGSPNREVRKLFEIAGYYRAALHRQPGERKWADEVKRK